jgi:dienelactone hydrolase
MRLHVKHSAMNTILPTDAPPKGTNYSSNTLAISLVLLLCGCQDLTARATRIASDAGLGVSAVPGTQYRHQVFSSPLIAGTPLYVFIEGDGSPWRRNGTLVADDPTPHHALALELATRTPGSVIYLGRPCYFSARNDAACESRVWSSQRYSALVVESMAAVANRYAAANNSHCVILVGYSGGGTLAVLMAPLIPAACAVVTIAADLDIEAWTAWHGYLPLEGSLNPATQAALEPLIQQLHLVGDRDTTVPPRLSRRYFDRLNSDQVWHFAAFDHVCCWVETWPEIITRIGLTIEHPTNRQVPIPSAD